MVWHFGKGEAGSREGRCIADAWKEMEAAYQFSSVVVWTASGRAPVAACRAHGAALVAAVSGWLARGCARAPAQPGRAGSAVFVCMPGTRSCCGG